MANIVQDTPMYLKGSPSNIILLILFFFALAISSIGLGQTVPVRLVGQVLYTNGLVTLSSQRNPLQIIAKDQTIYTGDRIATGLNSKAIIKLLDGSQISLVENSEFLVSRFSIEKNKEHAELQLFRGGVRAVSGLVNQFVNKPVNLLTPIGNVAIRGTDFTAFLCNKKCQINSTSSKVDSLVTGRLVLKKGDVSARETSGRLRTLYESSPLYEGDIISVQPQSTMVAVFRDDTRVTLNSDSAFQLGNYRYRTGNKADTANNPENYAAFKLLKGSMRFLTGEIAKINQSNYVLSTPTYNLQPEQAGVDIAYFKMLNIALWKGKVNFVFAGKSISLFQGDKYQLDSVNRRLTPIEDLPSKNNFGPRPDSVEIEQIIKNKKPFTMSNSEGKSGLYLYVRNGEIEVQKGQFKLNLGSQEVGFVGSELTYRINRLPDFLLKHFIDPRVNQKTLDRLNLLPDLNIADPDGPICEI